MSVVVLHHSSGFSPDEYGRHCSLTIPSGQVGLAQVVVVSESSSSTYPAQRAITVGGQSASSSVTSTLYVGGYYFRVTAYKFLYTTPGSAYVDAPGLGLAYDFAAYAFSFYNVDHSGTDSTSGTGTSAVFTDTIDDPGSYSVFATAQGVLSSSTSGYSGSTLVDEHDAGTASGSVGYEYNSSTSVSSGTFWGTSSVAKVGRLILLYPMVETLEIIPTGATVTATGGEVDLHAPIELDPTGATVDVTGGTLSIGAGTDFFVDTQLTTGDNDGTSWENAFQTLTAAIAAVTDDAGDRVFVKACKIVDIVAEIETPNRTAFYGGFSRSLTGTSAPIDERDPFSDLTIVSPTYSGAAFGCFGEAATPPDIVRIDGFFFLNCSNATPTAAYRGGAIRANGDYWTIANCWFRTCTVSATGEGGAIAAYLADNLTIDNCRFQLCSGGASTYGGAIMLRECSAVVTNCTFDSCDAANGGAIAVYGNVGSSNGVTITNATANSCNASSEGNSFWGYLFSEDVVIYQSRFQSGEGTSSEVYYLGDSTTDFIVSNSLIANSAGDGIKTGSASLYDVYLVNCTIADNAGYGINYSSGGSKVMTVSNSIIWDNTAGEVNGTLNTCQYSNVQGGYSGTGNIDVDPGFRGSGHQPYALNETTTCIDGGNAGVTYYAAADITGFTRVDTPDMGAYEFQGILWPPDAIDVSYYRLQMNGNVVTGDASTMKFSLPYQVFETSHDFIGFTFASPQIEGRPECNPFRFASQMMIEDAGASLTERWNAAITRDTIKRVVNGVVGSPSWGQEFDEEDQSDSDYIGTSYKLATGLEFSGTYNDMPGKVLFDIVRYSCVHSTTPLDTDLFVYNFWTEGEPLTARGSSYCAKWLQSAASVATPDYPVSSGMMAELVRILNLLVRERRNPMSVPVFGRYITKWIDLVV